MGWASAPKRRVREILAAAGFGVPAGLGRHIVAQLSTLSWRAD